MIDIPCFVRAPGMGLALVDSRDDLIKWGYPVESRARAIAVAQDFAHRTLGLPERRPLAPTLEFDTPIVEELLQAWLHFGGEISKASSPDTLTPRPHAENRFALRSDDPHLVGCRAIDWTDVAERLETAGLIVTRRGSDRRSGISQILEEYPVFEVLDKSGAVVAEGKGFSVEHATVSALGEAIERMVARLPDIGRLLVASQIELGERGFSTPLLAAEDRDLYSERLPMHWVPAHTFRGQPGAIPAEMAYFPYHPTSGIKAFSTQHTSGLAAGASLQAASLVGLRECIETDAYWLSMRTRTVCRNFGDLRHTNHPKIKKLVRHLADAGIRTHAGLINFDWPISIAHVVLETQTESLPCLSHGLGMAFDHVTAVERALLEAVQVYSGLEKVCLHYWPEIVSGPSAVAEPALFWADRVFAERITQPFEDAPVIDISSSEFILASSFYDLVKWMQEQGMTPWKASLGQTCGLDVVRVLIDGAVSPFTERGAPSSRVRSFVRSLGLKYPYFDPVLT